jgi:pimeloyl-ACP methyl ester carboxylesterase
MTTYHTIPAGRHQVFVREAGEPTTPTLLLLHGFPSSSAQFQRLLDRLEDRCHLVAPDYPGFGFSSTPDSPVTFDQLADALESVVDALGLRNYILYLFDFGAPVGFRLLERRPDAVQGLVVQNANAYQNGIGAPLQALTPYWQDRPAHEQNVREMLLTPEATRNWYALGVRNTNALDPAAWALDQALLERPGRDRVALDLIHDYPSNVARYYAWQQLLRQRGWPTLIAWGEHDPFFVVDGARAYLTDLPNAELHLLDSGHFATATHTPQIAELIKAFLTAHLLQEA